VASEGKRQLNRRVNMVQILCTHECKRKKIRVETIAGVRGGGIKENGGEGEFKNDDESSMIHLIYCKNLCKCHNVPLARKTIKRKKRKAHNLVTVAIKAPRGSRVFSMLCA
jgi:hypothetical protein